MKFRRHFFFRSATEPCRILSQYFDRNPEKKSDFAAGRCHRQRTERHEVTVQYRLAVAAATARWRAHFDLLIVSSSRAFLLPLIIFSLPLIGMASAGDTVTSTGTANAGGDCNSRTFSQLGLDADDALFGHCAQALLECETLAALHAAKPNHQRSAAVSPINGIGPPFRVAIARNSFTNPVTGADALSTRPATFEVETPLSDQHLSADGSSTSFSPGSAAWRVRTAFADRSVASVSASCSDAVDSTPQPAIRVSVPARTLTQYAWLESWVAIALMWALPATTVISFYLAVVRNPQASNPMFVIAFFACGMLSLMLIFSRIETASLFKRLLFTFEAAYLVVWMLVFLVASAVQIPNEIGLRTAKLGMESHQYILFCIASFFCMTMAFVVVLFSDALIHVSAWFKIYVRAIASIAIVYFSLQLRLTLSLSLSFLIALSLSLSLSLSFSLSLFLSVSILSVFSSFADARILLGCFAVHVDRCSVQ